MISILKELPVGFIAVFLGILGASVGSFLNVVIYRLPRNLSLFKPGSHCTHCQTPIRPWHNIPIISYFMLGRRCASCGAVISMRYPIVETLSVLVSVLAFLRFGWSWSTLGGMVLSWHLIALAFIDWDTMTLPDHIVLPMGIAGILFVWINGGLNGFLLGLISAAIGVGFLLILFLLGRFVLRREALGTGDITMTAAFGMYLKPETIVVALFIASLLTLLAAFLWAIWARQHLRQVEIPFAPALSLGAIIAFFYGMELLPLYFSGMIRGVSLFI